LRQERTDGYTLLMGSTAELALGVAVNSRLPYAPERDLAPIIAVSIAPLLFVVHPSVPARNIAEFVALARRQPAS
jgi:tripartite-type tricarboxylate transporter receptor subunit TctC